MASSGSFYTSAYQYRRLLFSWSINSQSIENNTTTISWTLKGASTQSSDNYYYLSGNFNLVINGSTVYSSSNRIQLWNGTTVASGTTTITHNSDGTKTFSASAEAGIYNVAVNCSGSGSWELTTIPRATKVSATSGSTIGSSITVTLAPASSAFTHNTFYRMNGVTSWTTIGTGYKSSFSFTPAMSCCSNIPNSATGTLQILTHTYNGSTKIGESTYNMTVSVPSSVIPTISSISVTETVSGLAAKFGAFVKNKSIPKVSITAAGVYGSSIKSYSSKLGSNSYTTQSYTSNVLTDSTSVTSTVTDSRGRASAAKTQSVTVVDYFNPTCSISSVTRCNSDGTINSDGTNVSIKYTYSIASVGNKNDHTVKIQYLNGSTWTTLKSFTTYSGSGTYVSTGDKFSIDKSYQIRLVVTDYFTTSTSTGMIPTAYTLINFNASGKGIAFGKVSEDNTFEVSLNLGSKILSQIFNKIYPVGAIYISMSETSPASLFGGTWERMYNRFLLGASSTYPAESKGGETTHVLTAAEQPSVTGSFQGRKSVDGYNILDTLPSPTSGCFTYEVSGGSQWGSSTAGFTPNSSGHKNSLIKFDNGGKGTAHNNMPPYLAVYMWKRTA